MNVIEHVCEPSRLVLTWQSPDLHGKQRKRYGVADLVRTENDAVLVYRTNDEVNEARSLGYAGYPAFRMDAREHANALPAFKRRLPPRERSDFAHYLRNFRLHRCDLSDFALLAYTEAKLPSDGFGLVDQLQDSCVPSEHLIELAGFRYYLDNAEGLIEGVPLTLEAEPNNQHDPHAVVFRHNGKCVGYVHRFQAATFNKWLGRQRIEAVFERRNGTAERPRAYAFVTGR